MDVWLLRPELGQNAWHQPARDALDNRNRNRAAKQTVELIDPA
jgi:hypothetical protein